MLFPFLQYISPTWYFNLPSAGAFAFFPDYDKLPEQEKALLEFDSPPLTSQPLNFSTSKPLNLSTSKPLRKSYSTHEVSKLDAAYQAWHKGFIISDPTKSLDRSGIQPTVSDNYRFIRRYFHPLWSWYVLALRLITLHNPIREIAGFIRHMKVSRVNLYKEVYPHELTMQTFESNLLKSKPKVSVIIPTLNRYMYLKDALHDLENQDYSCFDVIVIDQSEPFDPEFYQSFRLDLQVIRQEEKALWLARNTAVKTSDAEYLLLYDDDSRVEPDWISQHLKCLDYFQADISSGVSISVVGAKVPANYSFFRWSDQLDTGNVLIKREVFRGIGLFDRQFEGQRMGDAEFGLRAYLAGFKNISNPRAQRLHLKVGEGGLRQMGHWDAFRPKSWLAPRPVPSVLYLVRKYFGSWVSVLLLIQSVPFSLIPYEFKRNRKLLFIGIPLSFLLLPLILVQIYASWAKATTMLKEGKKIMHLNTSSHVTSN